jgi:hypothetical protein
VDGVAVRALFAAWSLLTCLALGWHEHAIRQADSHAHGAGDTAVKVDANARLVASWQASLSASVQTAIGDAEVEVRRRLDGICEGLYALARTVPHRADVPRAAREVCPGLPEQTAGAHEKLDPLAYRRGR